MAWPFADTFVEGHVNGMPDGPDILPRARARTLATPGLELQLRAHRCLERRNRPELRAEGLLDALLAVEAIEPRESEIVGGVVVLRFATLLRAHPPSGPLAADVWLDESLRVRRIAAVPAAGRGSAWLTRAMTGHVPRRRCWTLDVVMPRAVAPDRRACTA